MMYVINMYLLNDLFIPMIILNEVYDLNLISTDPYFVQEGSWG